MRSLILPVTLLLTAAAPALAALGEVTITSAILITQDLGECRGKVALNGAPGALVTIKNGAAAYTTPTDDAGNWSVVFGVRSNNITATARTFDGQTGNGTLAEAKVDTKNTMVPPASPELFRLTKAILEGRTAPTAANVAQLSKLMNDAILHGGGWEYDERMVLLMLGTIGRIVDTMGSAQATEQEQIRVQLGELGSTLYKAVCRGALDGRK